MEENFLCLWLFTEDGNNRLSKNLEMGTFLEMNKLHQTAESKIMPKQNFKIKSAFFGKLKLKLKI